MKVVFQDAIFRVVAAILHLGNIDFAKGKEIDSSVPKDDKAKFHLKMTAELLMYTLCSYCSFFFSWYVGHLVILEYAVFQV